MLDHRLLVNPPGGGVVTVKGSNRADGELVNGVSFEVDEDGYAALRVVDAAPFAYDDVNERLRVTSEPVEEAVRYFETPSTTVAASGNETIYIDPGAGYIGILTAIAFRASTPPDATSGTHNLRAYIGAGIGSFTFERIVSEEASFSDFSVMREIAADQSAVRGLAFTSADNLVLRYGNNTDKAQTNERRYLIYYVRRRVQSG